MLLTGPWAGDGNLAGSLGVKPGRRRGGVPLGRALFDGVGGGTLLWGVGGSARALFLPLGPALQGLPLLGRVGRARLGGRLSTRNALPLGGGVRALWDLLPRAGLLLDITPPPLVRAVACGGIGEGVHGPAPGALRLAGGVAGLRLRSLRALVQFAEVFFLHHPRRLLGVQDAGRPGLGLAHLRFVFEFHGLLQNQDIQNRSVTVE